MASAILHGVLPIVYEYEGTTLYGLLEHLTAVLQGRKARFELFISLFTRWDILQKLYCKIILLLIKCRSVGLFIGGESGSLQLIRGRVERTDFLGTHVYDPALVHEYVNITADALFPRLKFLYYCYRFHSITLIIKWTWYPQFLAITEFECHSTRPRWTYWYLLSSRWNR